MRNPTIDELNRVKEMDAKQAFMALELDQIRATLKLEFAKLKKTCGVDIDASLDSETMSRWVKIGKDGKEIEIDGV